MLRRMLSWEDVALSTDIFVKIGDGTPIQKSLQTLHDPIKRQ